MFDTYRAVTALREAGFQDEQAVALVSTIGDALTGDLATKSDIADLRVDLYRQMWVMGIAIVTLNVTLTVTLTVALIKLLP